MEVELFILACDVNMGMQSCTYWPQCRCLSGPYCSEAVEAVAGVAKHFNTVVISYSPEVQRVRDREQYPLFLSTVPHFLQYK